MHQDFVDNLQNSLAILKIAKRLLFFNNLTAQFLMGLRFGNSASQVITQLKKTGTSAKIRS